MKAQAGMPCILPPPPLELFPRGFGAPMISRAVLQGPWHPVSATGLHVLTQHMFLAGRVWDDIRLHL